MFSLVIVPLIAALGYVWHRMVISTTRPGRLRKALTWVFAGLVVLLVGTFGGARLGVLEWLAWPGYLWLAILFYLVVFLVLLEIPRVVARRSGARTSSTPRVAVAAGTSAGGVLTEPEPAPALGDEPPSAGVLDRRLFIGRATAAVAGVAALGTVGYGVRTALGDPIVEPVGITLPGLDPRLAGLRFAVVSDIHLGPITGIGHTRRIVRMINELRPDVVAIVGDLADGTVAQLGPLIQPLKSLESRYGSFFVTGNHEYYTAEGPAEWIEELDQLGVRSLRNERVEIRHQGGVLDLAGVNDLNGASMNDAPDFAKALGGRDTGRTSVLLAHQPVQVEQAARYGVDLQLSGHTHGGQMMPLNLVVGLQQPIVSGLATVDGVQVYVTRGAGFWGPPVRVGAPPEISLIELRS